MRSSLRLLNLEVTPLQGTRTRYVCQVCRHEARPRPLVARQFLRKASSESVPLTERVRRKLWGTDNPPGLKDPYGGEGHFEKKFKKSQASRQVQEETQEAAAAEELVEEDALDDPLEGSASGDYQPATTWKDLDRVGHLGRWQDHPPTKADLQWPCFTPTRRLDKPGHLALAAHQAAVEICGKHSLNRPLASVCNTLGHNRPVFDLILNCKIKSKDGQWDSALVYPSQKVQNVLVPIFKRCVPKQGPKGTKPVRKAKENPFWGYNDVRNRGFQNLSLTDFNFKFAFLKRFSQLTGHFFPDATAASFTTVGDVISHIEKANAPKPKKLAQHLVANQKLTTLPNVKIAVKKVKPYQKDEELGRKKIIDAELGARGLLIK